MGIEKLNMKISSNLLLPILLADAKRTKSRKEKLGKVENSGDRILGQLFHPVDHPSSNCAERIESTPPVKGINPTFESSVAANGLSGKVKLSDYPKDFECMHEIVADDSCQAIVVEYESVAVESGYGCQFDQFRFAWSNGGEELQTDANCHCNNEASCDVVVGPDHYHTGHGDPDDYGSLSDREDSDPETYGAWLLPSDGFSVNANKFKFYFLSDHSWYGGHVHFKWECVNDEVTTESYHTYTSTVYWNGPDWPDTTTTSFERTTTTSFERTTTTSTTVTTTTSPPPTLTPPPKLPELNPGNPDSCYSAHYGFEEFGDAVKAGIRRGLYNDILTYTRRPGVDTQGAHHRWYQFADWYVNNIEQYISAVTVNRLRSHKHNSPRKCLTDKFPRDNPGDHDKSILGSDCALDLTSIDAICENLPKFMDWAFADCRSNARTRQLHQRCVKLRRVQSKIQAHPWTSGPWIVNPWGSETTTSASTTTTSYNY